MAYDPGVLHVQETLLDGTSPSGWYVRVWAETVDGTVRTVDGALVFNGPTQVDLVPTTVTVDGEELAVAEASVKLPPTVGMDPDPVTYGASVYRRGLGGGVPTTGVVITAGEVTELGEWVPVPTPVPMPNVQKAAEAARDRAKAAADAAEGSEQAAAGSATAAAGSADAAADAAGDAGDARDTAVAAAAAATTKAGEAATSKTGADTAKTAAEAAKGAAESARDDAVAARGGAEGARDAAIVAKGAAETARDGAVTARVGAEAARVDAVQARADAVAARGDAITARDTAVGAKGDAQTAAAAAAGSAQTATDKAAAIPSMPTWSQNLARNPRLATGGYLVSSNLASTALAGLTTPWPLAEGRRHTFTAQWAQRVFGSVTAGALPQLVAVRFWAAMDPDVGTPFVVVQNLTDNVSATVMYRVDTGGTVGNIARVATPRQYLAYLTVPAGTTKDIGFKDVSGGTQGVLDLTALEIYTVESQTTPLPPYTDGAQPGARFLGAANASISEQAIPRPADVRSVLMDYRGTGSPEGVVAAPPGSTYTDLAGTTGAWVWRKRTGTAATGWVVVDGDTGLRRILAPGDVPTMPNLTVAVQRINNTVEVIAGETASGTASGVVTLTNLIPTGFRLPGTVASLTPQAPAPVVDAGGALLAAVMDVVGGSGTVILRGVAAGVRHYSALTYQTSTAWPTTLPGTAA